MMMGRSEVRNVYALGGEMIVQVMRLKWFPTNWLSMTFWMSIAVAMPAGLAGRVRANSSKVSGSVGSLRSA
jgi:hypothetical protein